LVAVALTVLILDIATKVTVVALLSDRAPARLLGGLLTFRVFRNPGAAFSIGPSLTLVFTAIAVGVIIYILRTSRRIRSVAWATSLGLLLGGATGNLTDRIFRSPGPLRGYVVDWIQVPHWPVFNISDSAIVCGGVLAVLLAARGIRIDGTRVGGTRAEAATAGETAAAGTTAAGTTADGTTADGTSTGRPGADGTGAGEPVAEQDPAARPDQHPDAGGGR
jgi:signal peptidase II